MRVEHVDGVAHAGLVGLFRQVARALGRGQRLHGQLVLLGQRLCLGNGVGHVRHGVDDGGVVLLHGAVVDGRLAAQLGAQAGAGKDGQAQRGGNAADVRVGIEKMAEAKGLEAGERHQIHVRVELGLGGVDALRRRFHSPALGGDVGTAADQVGRQGGGNGQRLVQAQHGARERRAGARPLAGQGRQLVAQQGQRFGRLLQLAASRGQGGFDLRHVYVRADAGLLALARDVEDAGALRQAALDHVLQLEFIRQLDVGAHQRRFQGQAGHLRFGRRHLHVAQRGGQGGAVAAPQVQVVRGRDGGLVAPRVIAGQRRRRAAMPRIQFAVDGDVRVGLRAGLVLGRAGQRLGLAHARLGAAQGGAVGQRLLHQTVQLGVMQVLPPLRARPLYGGAGGRIHGLAALQGIGVEHGRLRRDMAHVGASAQGKDQAGGKQTTVQGHAGTPGEICRGECGEITARRGELREWPECCAATELLLTETG